jgi:hypothetical protein
LSDCLDGIRGPGVLMLVLYVEVSFIRVFKGQSGVLVSGEVIFLTMMFCAGAMGVSGKVMMLSSYAL